MSDKPEERIVERQEEMVDDVEGHMKKENLDVTEEPDVEGHVLEQIEHVDHAE